MNGKASTFSVRKPKILLLGHLPPPYMGPAIATEILLSSSLKEAFSIVHLDTNTHEHISTLNKFGIRRTLCTGKLYARMFFLLAKHRPDLVLIPISQTTPGFLKDSIYILISRLFGHSVLLQLRGSNFRNWVFGTSSLMKRYTTWVLKQTKGIIVLGQNLRRLFDGFFPADRIFVVPNGADFHIPLYQRAERIRILFLANPQKSKGIEDVISAIGILKAEYLSNDFELFVIGNWLDDKLKLQLMGDVAAHELPVEFHPTAVGPDKMSHYSRADIFVFPPREPEGHPWVIVEAMAAGLPVISTDQGAIAESVVDGVNGFIVEKQNPQQIADKLKLLIEYPELRHRMGEESRRQYEENFTEAKMVAHLSLAFQSVL